jgi:hypothetical protein
MNSTMLLEWRAIEARGGIAWEIENDDGQTMGRDEIQAQLRARGKQNSRADPRSVDGLASVPPTGGPAS